MEVYSKCADEADKLYPYKDETLYYCYKNGENKNKAGSVYLEPVGTISVEKQIELYGCDAGIEPHMRTTDLYIDERDKYIKYCITKTQ